MVCSNFIFINDVTFFSAALITVKTSFDTDGYLKDSRLKVGKIFATVVLVITCEE